MLFFFFQAEDGIRDGHVTGVQTCALPISIVLDENNHVESRELIDRLRNSDTFRVIAYAHTDRELNDAIISGRAKVAVKIPWDYSDQLLKHGTAQVLVLIDGSDSSVAGQTINVATAIGLDESLQRVLGGRQALPVEMRSEERRVGKEWRS